MRLAINLFILHLFFISNMFAAELVLNGLPNSSVASSKSGTKREVLKKSNQLEYRVMITKEGEQYYWASRGNKKLVYFQSGAIHFFVDPSLAGYITVIASKYLFEDTAPKYQYKEHIRNIMGNVTYWGGTESFSP